MDPRHRQARDFHAALINGDERMRYGAGLGRWSIWALAAAVPLGCAAFFFARRRRNSDDYEAWWRQREHVRTNGHHVEPGRGLTRRDDLFV